MKIISSVARPGSQAVECGKNLWLVSDVVPGVSARAPIRTDLPKSHPLYGKRALKRVPAGSPDIIDDDAKGVVYASIADTASGGAVGLPIGESGERDSGNIG